MKYHLIREIVVRGDVAIEKIAFAKNLANPFTKTLSTRVFDGNRDNIGVRCISSILQGQQGKNLLTSETIGRSSQASQMVT